MGTTKVETQQQLDELIERIRVQDCHFIGYAPPMAMVSFDNDIIEVPIGHFIPALMKCFRTGTDGRCCPYHLDVDGDDGTLACCYTHTAFCCDWCPTGFDEHPSKACETTPANATEPLRLLRLHEEAISLL